MSFVETRKSDGIVTLTLARGKVNAINGELVDDLRAALETAERDPDARAVIITGAGKFFSFGFDIPEFLSFEKERFAKFLVRFTDLYQYLFGFPKPVIAALNGHAVAGGCMLALACDVRLMVRGNAKIALNEINFGAAMFAGSAEMLRYWVGNANATKVLFTGAMFEPDEALRLGLINEIHDDVMTAASSIAADLGAKHPPAFAGLKSLLRKPILDDVRRREAESIREFVEIWYSPATWEMLKKITIR